MKRIPIHTMYTWRPQKYTIFQPHAFIWSIWSLLIKSDLKLFIHLRRSLYLYIYNGSYPTHHTTTCREQPTASYLEYSYLFERTLSSICDKRDYFDFFVTNIFLNRNILSFVAYKFSLISGTICQCMAPFQYSF